MYRLHLKKRKKKKTKQNKTRQNKKEPIRQSCIYHFCATREGNAQSRNQKQHSFYGDKRQNVGGISQKALGVHFPINSADFSGEGTGHFKSSGEQIWKSIGTNTELVRGVIGPISSPNDDLNIVFDDVVSLRGSCRNNSLPRSPREKLQLVRILSLRVKARSSQERNTLFVDRPIKQKHIHLDRQKGFTCKFNIQQK